MNEIIEIRNILRRTTKQINTPGVPGNRSDFSTTKKMQIPPLIMPNYGKRKCTPGVPKTKVSRVLLYDNVTQQHMLDVKRANLKIERERTERLFDLHKKSFSARVEIRQGRRTSTSKSITSQIEIPGSKRPSFHRNESNHTAGWYPGRPDIAPGNQTKLDRLYSTSSVETAHSLNLETTRSGIVLKLKTRRGRNKLLYFSDESGLFLNLFPLHKLYPVVTEDPRFKQLESLLVPTKETV